METVVQAQHVVAGDWMVVAGVGLRVLESTRVLERQCISFHAPDGEPMPVLYMPHWVVVTVDREPSAEDVLSEVGYDGAAVVAALRRAGFRVER